MSINRHLGCWREVFLNFSYGRDGRFDRRLILGLLLFAFLLRIPLLIYPEVIRNDGTQYIRHARQILSGDWWSMGRTHPFYPSLIALFHFFTPNDETAGILISVIFGALLVVPVFFLGKALFNEKVGIIAALLASVHPFTYTFSGSVLTESTYYFLLATSVFLGWKAFEKGRWTDVSLFGFFTALSYLTRLEAVGFLLIFGIWAGLINPPDGKRGWVKRVGIVLLATFCFLIVSSPYLIQLRRTTGEWQITKKISISAGSLTGQEEASVNRIRETKKITLLAFVKSPFVVAKQVAVGFLQSLYKFQQAFNPLLVVFLILGFVLAGENPFSIKINLYVLTFCIYLLGFIFPFFRVDRRYSSHIIPICLPWAAFGFLQALGWIRGNFGERKVPGKLAAISLAVILVVLFVQGRVIHSGDHRLIQKEVGYWMRDHLPPGVGVMSSEAQEAFYAERPWLYMPEGSFEEILQEARSKNAQFLVFRDKDGKAFDDLQKKAREREWIPLLDRRMRGWRAIVFQRVD